MLEAFVHLYLGHLFGDYVLQFGWIAENKAKRKGVLISHALLVYLSQIAFSLGYGFRVFHLLLITVVGITHYFFDLLKLNKGDSSWKWYLLDQLFHLITILAIIAFFTDIQFFIPEGVAEKLMLTIFNAYFLSFLGYFVFESGKPYKRDWVGYVTRGALPWTSSWLYMIAIYIAEILRNFLKRDEKSTIKKNFLTASLALLSTIIWEVLV